MSQDVEHKTNRTDRMRKQLHDTLNKKTSEAIDELIMNEQNLSRSDLAEAFNNFFINLVLPCSPSLNDTNI